ncbi:hypothetical protein CSUI_009467, partial [Cystoisospora suis]
DSLVRTVTLTGKSPCFLHSRCTTFLVQESAIFRRTAVITLVRSVRVRYSATDNRNIKFVDDIVTRERSPLQGQEAQRTCIALSSRFLLDGSV